MRAETYAAAELLQLRHSAYSKDFDVKIIPVLGQLEDRNVLTTWTSLQMHMSVNVLLLQRLLQHKGAQHLRSRTRGQHAYRAPEPNFQTGDVDLSDVRTWI